MSAKGTRVFQYYLDNFFKFPKEIKNDIIYCQRALKSHIKVHQMVIDVFEQQEDADPIQKRRILKEIESEIYEINAEQNFLFLRLRRIIDEFYKLLKKNDIPTDQDATNMIIAREVVPMINDMSIEVMPLRVLFRNTEDKLIERYFEVQKEKQFYEIEDSDDEQSLILIADKASSETEKNDGQTIDDNTETGSTMDVPLEETQMLMGAGGGAGMTRNNNANVTNLAQMSLLKPISQRMTSNAGGYTDATKFLQLNLVEEKSTLDNFGNYGAAPESAPATNVVKEKEQPVELPVSKNVKMSRLNLRQALNKARTENMVAKAAANLAARSATTTAAVTAAPPATVTPSQLANVAGIATQSAVTRKYEIKTRATRSNTASLSIAVAAAAAAAAKERAVVDLNSSSEDSNPERVPTPPQTQTGFAETSEGRTLPEHYGQELFLRIFQLFTPELLVQMQQRRSKRKRRNVHSNERADFHYGRIEYGSYPPPEKKRKAFLLSPQIKRGLQSKRPKRGSAEKQDDAATSRSSSSSPDEKRCCNECLKGGGCFEQCAECKGYYHQTCHREEDEKPSSMKKNPLVLNKQLKLCPACRRTQTKLLKKEAQQYETLHVTAQELEKKLAREKYRRANLQQESKMYKLEMRNLFNIVNTMKSDQENDSSE